MLAETYSLSESVLYALTMWNAGRRPGPPTPPTGRMVDVLTMTDDPYLPYYPGDDAVDWVGISLFHWRRRRGDDAAGLWRDVGVDHPYVGFPVGSAVGLAVDRKGGQSFGERVFTRLREGHGRPGLPVFDGSGDEQ